MANAPDRPRYSPQETAAVKAATIAEIVGVQTGLLERAPEKINLSDLAAVQRVANTCMQKCADVGVLPNFELLAAALGRSRRGLYFYLEQHPDTATTAYIDRLRTAWASMRQMAADRGVADVTMSIFVLLNSSLGFTNQHQIEISQPKNPLDPPDEATAEAVRAKYLAALPGEDEQ